MHMADRVLRDRMRSRARSSAIARYAGIDMLAYTGPGTGTGVARTDAGHTVDHTMLGMTCVEMTC